MLSSVDGILHHREGESWVESPGRRCPQTHKSCSQRGAAARLAGTSEMLSPWFPQCSVSLQGWQNITTHMSCALRPPLTL